MIKIKNLTKIYSHEHNPIKALDNINIEIEKGCFAVLAGPSGSGKTTLLNMIGAMDYWDKGDILINDKSLKTMNNNDRYRYRRMEIGFIFQSYNLIPVLTCYENIELSMYLIGEKNYKNRILNTMDRVGILDLKDRKPSQISGGQQQRVAIARAIIKKPQLILADEPTANLDSKTGIKIIDLMHELYNDEKINFIFSSHDHKIINHASQVINLTDGKIVSGEL